MRFTFIFVAVTSALSASASIVGRQGSLPSCAATCLQKADYGSCGQTDNVCLCKSQPFITSTTQCIESACSGSDLQAAEAYSQAVCKSVGVTLTDTATTATSPTTSTSSATASSSSTGGALSTAANAFTGVAALSLAFIFGL